jgi:hypothetical protein
VKRYLKVSDDETSEFDTTPKRRRVQRRQIETIKPPDSNFISSKPVTCYIAALHKLSKTTPISCLLGVVPSRPLTVENSAVEPHFAVELESNGAPADQANGKTFCVQFS